MNEQVIKEFNSILIKSNNNHNCMIDKKILSDKYSLVFYRGYEDYDVMRIITRIVKTYYWNDLINLIHNIDSKQDLLSNQIIKRKTLSKYILDNNKMVDLLYPAITRQWITASLKQYKTVEYIATVLIFNYFVLGKGKTNEQTK
jgi:hypothetical protein